MSNGENYITRSFMIVLLTQYCAADKKRRMGWAGHVARMREKRGVYRVLVGKHEGKILFGRPRHRWEDNSKMDLQEVGCGDWMERAGSG
jgi:hypothetical protein